MPVIPFQRGQRKDDVATWHRARFHRPEGVVFIGTVQPSLHGDFKHSHVKQYFKEGWALRMETTFNDPTDVQPTKALETLPHLRLVGQQINARLLETEHLGAVDVPEPSLIDRMQQPLITGRRRVAALRLSDQRVLALLQALCQVAPRPDGFRRRRLLAQVGVSERCCPPSAISPVATGSAAAASGTSSTPPCSRPS